MFLRERYFIKVVPQRGDVVHRFEITRRHIVGTLLALAIVLFGSIAFAAAQTLHARAEVATMKTAAAHEGQQIRTIDSATAKLHLELLRVQKQNQEIQRLMGVHPKPPKVVRTSWNRTPAHARIAFVAHRVRLLESDSSQTLAESNELRRLAMHLLNVRHLASLALAGEIAAIPSIDPVSGAPVVGCFCYRTYPDSEFHPGVDLGADYGATVHAAAAGVVASAGWDGGYGLKIDIDHGNGYHTWYAHLSRMDVRPGERVYKDEIIGLVGSTGFSTGPHLHYQVMLDGTPVDPTPYLNGVPPKVLAAIQ